MPPSSPNPDPISDQKNVIFHTRFQTRPLKFIPIFRPGLKLLKLERKQNNSSNAFGIRMFLCRSYSSGIKTITTLVRSRSSLENHTRLQTKMGEVCTCFQTKKAQKSKPFGAAHTYMAYIRGYHSPPPPNQGASYRFGELMTHEGVTVSLS